MYRCVKCKEFIRITKDSFCATPIPDTKPVEMEYRHFWCEYQKDEKIIEQMLSQQREKFKRMIAERMQGSYKHCADGFLDLLKTLEKNAQKTKKP